MGTNQAYVQTVVSIGLALVLGFMGLIVCSGAGCWFGGGTFVRFGIGTDIEDYRTWVRQSDLPEGDKAELTARLDRVGRDIEEGDLSIPFVIWVDIDDEIERALSEPHVTEDELAGVHDQLNRIETYRQ